MYIDEKSFLQTVGLKIQKHRKKIHMTQNQLSQALDISPITLSQIERGVAGTTLKQLYKISHILKMPAHYFLTDDDLLYFSKAELIKMGLTQALSKESYFDQ